MDDDEEANGFAAILAGFDVYSESVALDIEPIHPESIFLVTH